MDRELRKKYIEKLDGDGKLYERELLNILLSNAYSGRDMSDVTESLLSRFPSVRAILDADYREIVSVKGVTQPVALYLKTIGRIDEMAARRKERITSTEEFCELIKKRFSLKDNEHAELYILNRQGKIEDIVSYTSGSVSRVDISVQDILPELAARTACGIYLAHNHVNCPSTPSREDDNFTLKLLAACKIKELKFYDHCIVNSEGETFSYLKAGRLKELSERIGF